MTDFGGILRALEIPGDGNYENLAPHTAAGRPKDLEAIAELEAILDDREG